jgi:hypothetical protein
VVKREQRIDGYRASLEGAERERAARAQLADQCVREARARLKTPRGPALRDPKLYDYE